MASHRRACYANVMSIRRITISVPADVAVRIKKAAGKLPVSAWVTGVIEEHLDDADLERLWDEFYRSVRPDARDVRRANAVFRQLTRPRRRRRAA
jgi:hypothetical protein